MKAFFLKRWPWIAAGLSLLLFLLCFDFYRTLYQPIPLRGQSEVFELPQGASLRQVANLLQQKQLIRRSIYFIVLAKLEGLDRRLKAGRYQIYPGSSAVNLLHRLAEGDVQQQCFTIVEGWTVQQLLAAMQASAQFNFDVKNQTSLRQALTIKHPNSEGLFLPETYCHDSGSSATEFLARAHDASNKWLAKAWPQRDKQLRYQTSYQALIAASIIEKEASIDKERFIISGIIDKRLKAGMRLQMDPTVVFGLGKDYSHRLTRSDLKQQTPYNTYLNSGLPPTPIALAGKRSITAALHPQASPYWYFYAKGDGSHIFSVDLAQQRAAIARYPLTTLPLPRPICYHPAHRFAILNLFSS